MIDLPKSIFRYRAVRTHGKHWNDLLERESKATIKNNLWFSNLADLNDPMEAWCNITESRAICSFSSCRDNMMLWSLYAKPSGYCIEYDTETLLESLGNVEARLIDYEPAKLVRGNPSIWKKFQEWEGEKEIRLASDRAGAKNYSAEAVRRIYFGPNFGDKSPEDSNGFKNKCRSLNFVVEDFSF